MKPIKLIIDTDPGVDDAMATLYAAAHPGLEMIGLTTVFGNVPLATATRNAMWLTELAGLNIPVAEGAAAPLVQPLPPHPDFVHGIEGFGNLPPCAPKGQPDPRTAARFLCETTAAHPGQVTICAVGPLTNLAEALELAPSIAHNVGRVVVMGGEDNTIQVQHTWSVSSGNGIGIGNVFCIVIGIGLGNNKVEVAMYLE